MLNKIKAEKENLEKTVVDTSLVDYLSTYSVSIGELIYYSYEEVVRLLFQAKYDLPIEKTEEKIEEIQQFLDDFDHLEGEEIDTLITIFQAVIEEYADKLKDYSSKSFLSVKTRDEDFRTLQGFIKGLIKSESEEKVDAFLKWLCDDELSNILEFGAIVKLTFGYIDRNEIEVPEDLNIVPARVINKRVDQIIKNQNTSILKSAQKALDDDLSLLDGYKNKKLAASKQEQRELNKKLRDLDLLEKDYLNNTLNIDSLKKYNISKELYKEALIELLKRKNENYKKVFAENQYYLENPVTKMENIFNSNGYNFNLLSEQAKHLLTQEEIEESIAENLNFFKTSSLSFLEETEPAFIKLLLLDVDVLMQLDSLLIRDKITKDFILKYYKEINALSVKMLCTNINKMDAQKINFKTLNDYNDKLGLDLNSKLFDLICLYGIKLNSENLKHYDFLVNPSLLKIIDQFIELGLTSQIQNLPNLITDSSSEVIKRIIVMQLLDENYLTEHITLNQTVRKGENFYLGDDIIDQYVRKNYTSYIDPEIDEILSINDNLEILEELPEELKYIEKYKKSDYTYMIKDKYFSRIKVLRYLNTLIASNYTNYDEMLFNCLIYNYPSTLSVEDINDLKNIKEDSLKKQII